MLDAVGDGVEGLRLGEVIEPVAGEGEIVLEVILAGLNPADRYLAEGQYPARPPLPQVLGRDAVGRVVEVGRGVLGVGAGDVRVVVRGDTGVNRWGTFAQRVAVASHDLVEVPAGWSLEESAGATLVYLTAWQALTMWDKDNGSMPKTVLVTGASGGVGVACVQLASSMGHRVIAMSRSEEKGSKLLEMGAAYVLDPGDENWTGKLKKDLGIRIDLAVDNIGGKLFSQLLEVMGNEGRISCVGRLAGPVPEFNTAALFFRRLRVGGVAVGSYTREEARENWNQIVEVLQRGGKRPVVDSVWEFEKLKEAFGRLGSGPMGKVLLRVKGN